MMASLWGGSDSTDLVCSSESKLINAAESSFGWESTLHLCFHEIKARDDSKAWTLGQTVAGLSRASGASMHTIKPQQTQTGEPTTCTCFARCLARCLLKVLLWPKRHVFVCVFSLNVWLPKHVHSLPVINHVPPKWRDKYSFPITVAASVNYPNPEKLNRATIGKELTLAEVRLLSRQEMEQSDVWMYNLAC